VKKLSKKGVIYTSQYSHLTPVHKAVLVYASLSEGFYLSVFKTHCIENSVDKFHPTKLLSSLALAISCHVSSFNAMKLQLRLTLQIVSHTD
jgi:uncharacterized membrane protein